MDKYLSKASYFMTDSDQLITEAKKEDAAAAVVIATEGKKEDADKKVVAALSKDNLTKFPNKAGMFKKKKAIKEEEDEEDVDADTLEEKVEEKDAVREDEDDGSEDGEKDELTEGEEDDETGEEEGDEIADDDQVEDPKKKKNVVESYLAHASRWVD
jgi:TATA-binding protein-associated factor Taf7